MTTCIKVNLKNSYCQTNEKMKRKKNTINNIFVILLNYCTKETHFKNDFFSCISTTLLLFFLSLSLN